MHLKRISGMTTLVLVTAIMLFMNGIEVSAQLRTVGRLTGIVEDSTGAVTQNATVLLKDIKTGITKQTVTSEQGSFLFPDLVSGIYEVTVSKTGFQTSVVSDISVSTSKTVDISVTLTVGKTTDTVTIVGDSGVELDTTSQLTANTLGAKEVSTLPLQARTNVLALARLAPGAAPPTGGSTRFNNMAGGATNVTVDGINDASNGWKSGGTVFYMTVPVSLGAVEEVSVETAGLGADSGAQSGANIKFTTKRGGNQYHGSIFYEPRSEQFNANNWWRNSQQLDALKNRTHDYGGNIGGPLIPFGKLKEKLFFFANFERRYQPITEQRSVGVLTPAAQSGVYTYLVEGTTNQFKSVNVLSDIAAKTAGAPVKIDPVIQSILGINNNVPKYARKIVETDPNRDYYTWGAENDIAAYFPATRVDYHLNPKHQIAFTWNYRHSWQPGARRLPVPDIQRSYPFRLGYYVWAASLQSTFSPTLFNEFKYGTQHSGDTNTRAEYGDFYRYNKVPLRINRWTGELPFGGLIPVADHGNTTGRHFITTMYDTLTHKRGEHTLTIGGSYRKTDWKDVSTVYQEPFYDLGTPPGDALTGRLANTATNKNTYAVPDYELGGLIDLYNNLTGRVAAANFTKVVNPETLKYDDQQFRTWTRSFMGGLYIQDSWRMRPSLTVNYGLRWEGQGAMHDVNGLAAVADLKSLYGPSKRLFAPGELSGNNDPKLNVGASAYDADLLNFAPNIGFAWNPTKNDGWLGKLLGGNKTVIRSSYSLIVYDEGTEFYAQTVGQNVGKEIWSSLIPGEGVLANKQFYSVSDILANPLTASAFPFETNTYAKTVSLADNPYQGTISGFDPTLRAPYTVNWNFGIQRELWKNNVLEIRYVGNQSKLAWRTSNLNEVNIFENGFLKEFKNAQNNLALHKQAGCGAEKNPCSFGRSADPNDATKLIAGQVALPIFDAAFGSRGSVSAIEAGAGYANGYFTSLLENGAAGQLASILANDRAYTCRMFGSSFSPCTKIDSGYANAPGAYPINFFVLNPFVADRINYVDDTGWHSYHGLQMSFNQRLSHGLTWQTNYTWSKSMTNLATDNAIQIRDFTTLRNTSLDKRVSQFDMTHVLQSYGTYELPVGRGRLLNINNKILDSVLGGWVVGNVLVFNTGQPLQLFGAYNTVNTNGVNNPNATGVRLAPGVTLEQIQEMFNVTPTKVAAGGTVNPTQRLGVDSKLIGPDGRANPKYLLPNTTPGEFGDVIFIRDKNNFQWDMSLMKNIKIKEKVQLQLFGSFNNVLNHPRWGFTNLHTSYTVGTLNVFSNTFGVMNPPINNRTINLRATLSF